MAAPSRRRQFKAIHDMAADMGYSPGEFSIKRFCEDARQLEEWDSMVRAGTVPPEFMGMPRSQVRDIVNREIADFIRRERDWLEFFHPKLKSQDVVVSEPVEMVVRWGAPK